MRDDERDWEGAAERLLRSFGLSMLVPDAQYAAVSKRVDRTQVSGRPGFAEKPPHHGHSQQVHQRAARRSVRTAGPECTDLIIGKSRQLDL